MAFDAFLKIEGIAGESKVGGMEESIDVDSYSFGAQNSGSPSTGGGAGAGKTDFSDINLVVPQSKATFQLLGSVASGKHHQTASLHLRSIGDTALEFLVLTLTDVVVTSLHESGTSGEGRPIDAISLGFAKIEWTYTLQHEDGTAGEKTQGSWDLRTNTP